MLPDLNIIDSYTYVRSIIKGQILEKLINDEKISEESGSFHLETPPPSTNVTPEENLFEQNLEEFAGN